uniref:Uncharacterized protein n=1 Tax=Ciona savignyi TaxID=51511 RepID=H2ZG51_CIOSA
YRIPDQPPGGTKDAGRSNNVADVVRSEIHNVLLAQQVSLLSQILLGQTLTGGSQVGGNPLVDNVLKSLLPAAPSVAKTEPTSEKIEPKHKPCEEIREEPHNIHENIESYEKPHGPVNHITSTKAKRRDYGIPLFHVPGITKSHEPKSVSFVPTPKSSTSWRASLAARQTYDGGHSGKPPKLINLNNRNKPVLANNLPQQTRPTYQTTVPSHPPQQGIPHAPPYERPNDPPNPVILKPPIIQHQPAAYTPQIQGPA